MRHVTRTSRVAIILFSAAIFASCSSPAVSADVDDFTIKIPASIDLGDSGDDLRITLISHASERSTVSVVCAALNPNGDPIDIGNDVFTNVEAGATVYDDVRFSKNVSGAKINCRVDQTFPAE